MYEFDIKFLVLDVNVEIYSYLVLINVIIYV